MLAFKLPQEITDIGHKINGLTNLRSIYVKTPFCYRKAVKCSTTLSKLNTEIWNKIYRLYPALKGKQGVQLSSDYLHVFHNTFAPPIEKFGAGKPQEEKPNKENKKEEDKK